MVGKTVVHASFGEGVIVNWNERTFSVNFGKLGTKHFDRLQSMNVFPETLLNAYEEISKARNEVENTEKLFLSNEINIEQYLFKIKELSDRLKSISNTKMGEPVDVKRKNDYYPASFLRTPTQPNYSPEYILLTSQVWKATRETVDDFEQMSVINLFMQMSSQQRLENWHILDTTEIKWKILFRAARNGNLKAETFQLPDNEADTVKLLGQLIACNDSQQRIRLFTKFHAALQTEIVDRSWDLSQNLDYNNLLPLCTRGVTEYCEGKPWPAKNISDPFDRAAFCPRMRKPCMESDGARIWPQNDLETEKWTLLELLSHEHITPVVSGLSNPEEYVPRMAGWINRINEIREKIRCSNCGSVMISNKKYSKNFAAYNATVFNCAHGDGHDHNVYLSHCWACRTIIDSRQNRIKDKDGYYLCLQCGSGSRQSQYNPGEICPQCGSGPMKQAPQWNRVFHCPRCSHTIANSYSSYVQGP